MRFEYGLTIPREHKKPAEAIRKAPAGPDEHDRTKGANVLTDAKQPAAESFRAARHNRIFEDIVEQMQAAILSGRFRPGETLPPERELREVFKTSRGTLREALRVLEQKGLIEIKLGVGGGAVVRAVSTDRVSESLELLFRSRSITLLQLAEFREGVEGSIAALAAEKRTAGDLQRLEGLLEEARGYRDAGPDSWGAFLSVDRQFHQEMAEVTGNPVYILVQKVVHTNIIDFYEQFLPGREPIMEENFQDLHNLYRAIADRDASLARSLMQSHVRRFNRHMEQFAAPRGEAGG
jgi:DNA-binding FadR family transcriptional regulator